MLDDIKSASQSVKVKFMEKMLHNPEIVQNAASSAIEINTSAAVDITHQDIVLKEEMIKQLDQEISLGSEIGSILKNQEHEAMADPAKVRCNYFFNLYKGLKN